MTDRQERQAKIRKLQREISATRERHLYGAMSPAERSVEFELLADLTSELGELQKQQTAEVEAERAAQRQEVVSPWLERSRSLLADKARLAAIIKDPQVSPGQRADAEAALAALPDPFKAAP